MNRFEYASASLTEGETVVVKHESVKIYDGHEKVKREIVKVQKYLIEDILNF